MDVGIAEAICAAVTACTAIYTSYKMVKILPDLAKTLTDRVQMFKPRLNQLMEGQPGPERVDPLVHLELLQKVLDDIDTYLKKLQDDSVLRMVEKHVFYQSLLEQYEELNSRLNQCRDDLKFDFEFDMNAERKAFENETKGLLHCILEQHGEHVGEQRVMREMIQGQRRLLTQILQHMKVHPGLGLNEQSSPAMVDAIALLDCRDNAGDVQAGPSDQQVAREYEIPVSEIVFQGVKLGAGAFGVVYKGTFNNQDIAIKQPHTPCADALKELISQQRCSGSPFVAHVFGFVSVDRTRSIVMEYAPCGTLASLISAASGEDGHVSIGLDSGRVLEATLPAYVLIQLLHKIALAIEFVHQRQIIHRDVKPGNILLGLNLDPKLSDFGSARELTDSATHATGSAAGSFYYMAPEVLKLLSTGRGEYTYTIDLYSFGAIIVHFCNRLFGGRHSRHCSPDKVNALPEAFQTKLTDIKDRCISRDPCSRYGRGSTCQHLVSSMLEELLLEVNSNVSYPMYGGFHGANVTAVANVARISFENQTKQGVTNTANSSLSRAASSIVPTAQLEGPVKQEASTSCSDRIRKRDRNIYIAVGVALLLVFGLVLGLVFGLRDDNKNATTEGEITGLVMSLVGVNTTFDGPDSELWTITTKDFVEGFYNSRRGQLRILQTSNVQDLETTLEITTTRVIRVDNGLEMLEVTYRQAFTYESKSIDVVIVDLVTEPFSTDTSRLTYKDKLQAAGMAAGNDIFDNLKYTIPVSLTMNPTPVPTTATPTPPPTSNPTKAPSLFPSFYPSTDATTLPSALPSSLPPTEDPTSTPSLTPSGRPSQIASLKPSSDPTRPPTRFPTPNPTKAPTRAPTQRPTVLPTKRPTPRPTRRPTPRPTRRPTTRPTKRSTPWPTRRPTPRPTPNPTKTPPGAPTTGDTAVPKATCGNGYIVTGNTPNDVSNGGVIAGGQAVSCRDPWCRISRGTNVCDFSCHNGLVFVQGTLRSLNPASSCFQSNFAWFWTVGGSQCIDECLQSCASGTIYADCRVQGRS